MRDVTFAGRALSARFRARRLVLQAGAELAFDRRDWRDALVVVEAGEVELEDLDGARARFAAGAVLCLEPLPLRLLRNGGVDPAVLVAVSRRCGTAASR